MSKNQSFFKFQKRAFYRLVKYLNFSQISQTDWVQSYWKFTDFIEITDFTEKYQVSPWNAIPFSVSLRKLVKLKGFLAHL